MPIFGSPLGSFRVASFEPRPYALIVTVGQTLGKVVGLLIKAREKSADGLLVSFSHGINDGPRYVNKQAWL